MASFKNTVLPALAALGLYILLTHVVVPLWRRHRARYAQYLPVQTLDLDQLSHSTSSLRHRAREALAAFLLPRRLRGDRSSVDGSGPPAGSDSGDDEDGEDGLGGGTLTPLGQIMAARREAHEARRSEVGRRQRVDSSDRRLSRDLEQGFMDSSDEDGEGGHEGGREVEGRGVRPGQESWRGGG